MCTKRVIKGLLYTKMIFSELYNFSQSYFPQARVESSPFFLPLGYLKKKLETGFKGLEIELKTNSSRQGDPFGHIEEQQNPFIAKVFCNRSLNTCYRRFIWTKELMHLFDSDDAKASSAEKFKKLLSEIEHNPIKPSDMFATEHHTKWMAILVLCPQEERTKVAARDKEGEGHYSIALDYRLPEAVIPHIVSDYYLQALDTFV